MKVTTETLEMDGHVRRRRAESKLPGRCLTVDGRTRARPLDSGPWIGSPPPPARSPKPIIDGGYQIRVLDTSDLWQPPEMMVTCGESTSSPLPRSLSLLPLHGALTYNDGAPRGGKDIFTGGMLL